MNSLDRIDTLLELDVLGGQLSLSRELSAIPSHSEQRLSVAADLILGLTQLLLGELNSARGDGGDLPTPRTAIDNQVSIPADRDCLYPNDGRTSMAGQVIYPRFFWKPLNMSMMR